LCVQDECAVAEPIAGTPGATLSWRNEQTGVVVTAVGERRAVAGAATQTQRPRASSGARDDSSLKAPYARGMASTSPIVPELPIIRTRQEGEQRATFFELFFDLVYVFAVTQPSHHLLDDLTWATAAETAFMLVALYWVWNYTTWMTNWFDPDTVPVRLVLVFVMLASLLMAVAIPEGFARRFACGVRKLDRAPQAEHR
jgi:hypothetical protein